MQTFWNALSGMVAGQRGLSIDASNMANEATTGYAKLSVSFSDLLTNHLSAAATAGALKPRVTAGGWWGGDGTAAVQPGLNFSNIGLQRTGNATDFAITGDAFFTVHGVNGGTEFTKAGNFHWAPSGAQWKLVTADGRDVLDTNGQAVTVKQPSQASISTDGSVVVGAHRVSQIGLAQVPLASQFLVPVSGTSYQLSTNGTFQMLSNPSGAGVSVQSGYLSTSNVDLSQEMSTMLRSQNLYESNARALQLSNQMMTTANKTHA